MRSDIPNAYAGIPGSEAVVLVFDYSHCGQSREELLARIHLEEARLQALPEQMNICIVVRLEGTDLAADAAALFLAHLVHIQARFQRLCVLGCPAAARGKLRRRLKRADVALFLKVRFCMSESLCSKCPRPHEPAPEAD